MYQYSDVLNKCIEGKGRINDIKNIFSLCDYKFLRVVHHSVSHKNVNTNTKVSYRERLYKVHSLDFKFTELSKLLLRAALAS